jgi:hypothetical protein
VILLVGTSSWLFLYPWVTKVTWTAVVGVDTVSV